MIIEQITPDEFTHLKQEAIAQGATITPDIAADSGEFTIHGVTADFTYDGAHTFTALITKTPRFISESFAEHKLQAAFAAAIGSTTNSEGD